MSACRQTFNLMFCVATHKATCRTQLIPSFSCGSRSMNTLVSQVLPPSLFLAGNCNGYDLSAGSPPCPTAACWWWEQVCTRVPGWECTQQEEGNGKQLKLSGERSGCARESLNQPLEGNQETDFLDKAGLWIRGQRKAPTIASPSSKVNFH